MGRFGSAFVVGLLAAFLWPTTGRAQVLFLSFDVVDQEELFPGQMVGVPQQGEPPPGAAQVEAALAGPVQSAVFQLVDVNGFELSSLALTTADLGAEFLIFQGAATIPGQTFRARVSGADGQGQPFDVTLSRLFAPQLVQVKFSEPAKLVEGGSSPMLTATIKNLGASATFNLSLEAQPEAYLVTQALDPTPIANAGEVQVQLEIQIPLLGGNLETFEVKLIASSQSDARSNSGTGRLDIVRFAGIFEDSFESGDATYWSPGAP